MYDLHIGPDRSVFGSSLHLDRTDRSKQLRWTEPIGPGDTDGPDRTNSIGSIRLGLKSVGPGRYRSGPDRGCPYLLARGISVYEIMMYKNHLSRKYQKELVLFEDAGAMVDRGGGGQT